MAPLSPAAHNDFSEDELDQILHDIIDDPDLIDKTKSQTSANSQNQRSSENTTADLGLDEEVKVSEKKPRQPIPKLDENRLLSDAGIPRLRRISKDRLRFKGKGHEYGDIARMLNMYQLWLDDLYPRAKFADGLSMIEKLGHTKRIQYMRKEWIDEGRPKNNTSDVEPDEDEPTSAPVETVEQNTEQMDWLQRNNPNGENDTQEQQMQGKLLRPAEDLTRASENAEPDDDELDALLAESELQAPDVLMTSAMPPKIATSGDDMFADEMEAMAEMEGW